MEYRQLGRTGEKVSTIGMGTWRFGTHGSQNERAEQLRALGRGVELGINLIDTAEIYASGRSEEIVGEATKGIRDKVFIATKVAPGHLHHDDVIRACAASLKRLGTNYIDLYQVHWPDPSVPMRETMGAMEKLVKDGSIRYIGVSNFSVRQTEAARRALSANEIVSNQVEYSMRNRDVESEVLPYCERENVTLIAYSPLGKGHIADSLPESVLTKYKMTSAQAMLNWVTRNEHVVAIPKASNLSHVEENAESIQTRFEPDEYELISKS